MRQSVIKHVSATMWQYVNKHVSISQQTICQLHSNHATICPATMQQRVNQPALK